ncbi:hypothetical protein KJ596_00570 [Patescibacteria group bacterium]|nr:hypothetical protein [Patescibacteria group bacterium]
MGGRSAEKEISLESARHVYNHLDPSKYILIPIFTDRKMCLWHIPESLLWLNTCSDIEGKLNEAEQITYEILPRKIDFAFLTTHGKYGEDCLPALLHLLRIPNNSCGVLGGAINMDKFMQRKLLIADGLNVPLTVGIRKKDKEYQCIHLLPDQFAQESTLSRARLWTRLAESLNRPFVIKPSREGCSLAINKVTCANELHEALAEAFQYDNLILAEEFLEGKEITTTVLGNEEPFALTPTETPSKGDYLTVEEKFLPGDAQMITPPDLPKAVIKQIKAGCVKAYQSMELRVFSRIDGFWCPSRPEGSKFVILEPNSPPGMTPSTCIFHQAAEEGWSQSDFFDKIIKFGLNNFTPHQG